MSDYWGSGYIPVFTVWKYLVGGIYQRGDLKLKSVKIGVQGPFNGCSSQTVQCRRLLLSVLFSPVCFLLLYLVYLLHDVHKVKYRCRNWQLLNRLLKISVMKIKKCLYSTSLTKVIRQYHWVAGSDTAKFLPTGRRNSQSRFAALKRRLTRKFTHVFIVH